MKKILLSLATMLCASAFASADEVTIDLNSNTGFTGDKNSYTASTNGFTLTIDKASATSDLVAPSEEARIYKGATFTVTGDNGQQITQIVIVSTDSSCCGISSASVGKGSWSGTTYTWTGDANSIVFDSSAAQTRAKSITITYTPGAGVVVDAPQFSVESGIYFEEQTVAITAGDGSTIYYTTDGATPTDDVNDGSSIQYTKPITISTTTTIKAIAFDADDNKSNVTTAIYTIAKLLEGAEGDGTEANPFNVAAAHNAANQGSTATVYVKGYITQITEVSTSYGNATYSINDDTTYDEASALLIYRGYYGNDGTDNIKFTAEDQIAVGDLVVVYGTLKDYNGTMELTINYIVTLDGNTTGVEAIESDANAPVEYFNLQGVRVDNPAKGLYIMRQGSKVVKVVK